MERILVAVDDSDGARHATEWAAALASQTGASLTLGNAYVPTASEQPPEYHDELMDEERTRIEGEAKPLTGSGVKVDIVVSEHEHVDQALEEIADERDVDAIVLGSRGKGGFRELRLGGTARKVGEHVGRPVVIVPPQAPTGPIEHVVVGVDESEGSATAVGWVAKLAAATNCKVTAVHAQRTVDDEFDEAWVAPLADLGDRLHTVLVDDSPVPGLLENADACDAGLVIVGRREHRRRRLLLGTTPFQLMQHSDRAVCVVPES